MKSIRKARRMCVLSFLGGNGCLIFLGMLSLNHFEDLSTWKEIHILTGSRVLLPLITCSPFIPECSECSRAGAGGQRLGARRLRHSSRGGSEQVTSLLCLRLEPRASSLEPQLSRLHTGMKPSLAFFS